MKSRLRQNDSGKRRNICGTPMDRRWDTSQMRLFQTHDKSAPIYTCYLHFHTDTQHQAAMSFKAQTQTPDSSQAPPAPCDRAPLHRQFFGNIGAQVMYQTSVGPRQQSVPLVREVKDAKTPPSVSTEKKKSAQTPTLSGNSLSSNDEREALKVKNATNQ